MIMSLILSMTSSFSWAAKNHPKVIQMEWVQKPEAAVNEEESFDLKVRVSSEYDLTPVKLKVKSTPGLTLINGQEQQNLHLMPQTPQEFSFTYKKTKARNQKVFIELSHSPRPGERVGATLHFTTNPGENRPAKRKRLPIEFKVKSYPRLVQ
jgi:hypothetical protein